MINDEKSKQLLIEPILDEWLTKDRRNSLIHFFSGTYQTLFLFGNLDNCLVAWIENQIILDIIFNQSLKLLEDYEYDLLNNLNDLLLPKKGESKYNIEEFKKSSEKAIKTWCELQWKNKVDGLFLYYKDQLDLISCYYMRVDKKDIAVELYHRICNEEDDFASLGLKYGIGKERFKGSYFKSQPLASLPQQIRPVVRSMKENQTLKPYTLNNNTYALLRLERIQPAYLDNSSRSKIYLFHFEQWTKQILPQLHSILRNSL